MLDLFLIKLCENFGEMTGIEKKINREINCYFSTFCALFIITVKE